jgi:hypothetical protein
MNNNVKIGIGTVGGIAIGFFGSLLFVANSKTIQEVRRMDRARMAKKYNEAATLLLNTMADAMHSSSYYNLTYEEFKAKLMQEEAFFNIIMSKDHGLTLSIVFDEEDDEEGEENNEEE